MTDRCKNCGYCPHCGQSRKVPSWPYPYAPWVYPYPYQRYPNAYWQVTTTPTTYNTGGTIPSGTITNQKF